MNTNWEWPLPGEDKYTSYQGLFGALRKYGIHTGTDFYCNNNQIVVAVEDGEVVLIEEFTGENANPPSPWWNNTKAVLVEGKSGVVVYGEINPLSSISVGKKIRKGQRLGNVVTVLKTDKGTPMTMLHLELYKPGTRETVVWNLNENQPDSLLDPMPFFGHKKLFLFFYV